MLLGFPGRDLTPYAEYVEAQNLEVGKVYFRVSFLADASNIPEMIPLIFAGRNLEPRDEEDDPRLYFQNAESYLNGVRYHEAVEPDSTDESEPCPHPFAATWFETTSEGACTGVFEFEKALECLMRCSETCREKR